MEPNEETGAAQAAALPTDPPDPNDNGSPLGGPGKQIPAIALGVNVDEPQSPNCPAQPDALDGETE